MENWQEVQLKKKELEEKEAKLRIRATRLELQERLNTLLTKLDMINRNDGEHFFPFL